MVYSIQDDSPHQAPAVVAIQETHVQEGEAVQMSQAYHAAWGFNHNATPLSFWSETSNRAGGVALLLNPYLTTEAQPALRHLWSGNFIAITTTKAHYSSIFTLPATQY